MLLQQPLPFTVLKQTRSANPITANTVKVATALTVYGIETNKFKLYNKSDNKLQQPLPFTVLKLPSKSNLCNKFASCNSPYRLRY